MISLKFGLSNTTTVPLTLTFVTANLFVDLSFTSRAIICFVGQA